MRCEAETANDTFCDACLKAMPALPSRRDSWLWNLLGISTISIVVLFIIVPLLAGSGHHGRGWQSRSLNNIKQLTLATMQYSQDYQETFPGWVRNPDGVYAHNVWDEQIGAQVKSPDVYHNEGTGIRSYSQSKGPTATHDRVITYGLNGLLISPLEDSGGGDADFGSASADNPPRPMSPSAIDNPSGTILFAELATKQRFPGRYGEIPNPKPYTYGLGTPREYWKARVPETQSDQWKRAWDGWIDISPRDWGANGGPAGSYHEPYANGVTDYGVARDLYSGGGCYAF
jgi:hypothetical protein